MQEFRERGLGSIDAIALHHTAGSQVTRPADLARSRPDLGGSFPYGLLVAATLDPDTTPTVWYAGHLKQQRACVANLNDRVFCVAAAGNFQVMDPTEGYLQALAWCVAVTRAALGREVPVVGHGSFPGQGGTACPGERLNAVIGRIEELVADCEVTAGDVEWLISR